MPIIHVASRDRAVTPSHYNERYSSSRCEAANWLAFDSLLMTQLIGLARLPILRRVFQKRTVTQFILNLIQGWRFGTDDFVLATRAATMAPIKHGCAGKAQCGRPVWPQPRPCIELLWNGRLQACFTSSNCSGLRISCLCWKSMA
jgi:hypothetical protein